jgi:hypothetical protein
MHRALIVGLGAGKMVNVLHDKYGMEVDTLEIDTAVAIDEAVELAKALSTDDSPGYINGLLGRVAPIANSLSGE